MAANDSKNLGLAVVALVAFAALLVWVLVTPGSEPEPQSSAPGGEPAPAAPPKPSALPKPSAQQQQPAPAQAPAPQQPTLDVDLFVGAMPDFMVEAHSRVLDKKWLDVEMQKRLYAFGQEHKDDARPQLLLGWDSMNREWYGMAVRMYRIAYRADARAKYDPTMLRDLLWVASRHDRVEFRDASAIIREAYGEEALPRIDEELNAARMANEPARAARLERLRKEVAGR